MLPVSQLPGSLSAALWCHQLKTQNRRTIIFLFTAVMLSSVKPGDASNETTEAFAKALRCVPFMCVCAWRCLEIDSCRENIQLPPGTWSPIMIEQIIPRCRCRWLKNREQVVQLVAKSAKFQSNYYMMGKQRSQLLTASLTVHCVKKYTKSHQVASS